MAGSSSYTHSSYGFSFHNLRASNASETLKLQTLASPPHENPKQGWAPGREWLGMDRMGITALFPRGHLCGGEGGISIIYGI